MTSVPIKTNTTEQQVLNTTTPWVTVAGYDEKQANFAQTLINSQYPPAVGLGRK